MMRRRLFLILIAVFASVALIPRGGIATPVVADLSTYRIAIDAGFTGIRLFIFGARNDAGDIVVVIRGPERTFTVRKKERMMGMWINRSQLRFGNMPDFYAVASAKPLNAIEASALFKALHIGADTLLVAPQDTRKQALFPEFSDAFLAHQRGRRLYTDLEPLGFMGETLFKTVIPFPDTIPGGDYVAEIYLVSDGELVGMQSIPIRVEKTGFDAAVADLAHGTPLLYGLLAVLLALGAGYSAGRIFESA